MQQHSNQESYSVILREIVSSTRELIRNELILAKEELKITARRLASHSAQAAIFGGLLAASILPFLAFLVIGLGDLLSGRYWLSSLLVAIFCAGIGGTMTYLSFKKIKEQDLKLPLTKNTLEKEVSMLSNEINQVRDATKRRAI